jgi:hypothetical protein
LDTWLAEGRHSVDGGLSPLVLALALIFLLVFLVSFTTEWLCANSGRRVVRLIFIWFCVGRAFISNIYVGKSIPLSSCTQISPNKDTFVAKATPSCLRNDGCLQHGVAYMQNPLVHQYSIHTSTFRKVNDLANRRPPRGDTTVLNTLDIFAGFFPQPRLSANPELQPDGVRAGGSYAPLDERLGVAILTQSEERIVDYRGTTCTQGT